jgi:hypothetical protein
MHYAGTQIDTTQIDPSGRASDPFSFCSDAILPAQFYPARRGSASVEPIMRLMAGILIDAVRCFQNNFEARNASRQREFTEAELWIFDDKGTGPFSFQSVCDSLEVDPRGLRNSILRWQERRRSGERLRMVRRSPVNLAKQMQLRRRNRTGRRSQRCIASSEKSPYAGRPHSL